MFYKKMRDNPKNQRV